MSLELTLATEHSGEHSDLSQVKPKLLPDFTEEPSVLASPTPKQTPKLFSKWNVISLLSALRNNPLPFKDD